MKKKKEIEFNPADYDYMDSLSLAGWMWEIIRRSKEYRDFYKKWSKMIRKPFDKWNDNDNSLIEEYFEKYSPIFPKQPDDKRDWPLLLKNAKKTKLSPIHVVNLGIGLGVDAQHGERLKAKHPAIIKKTENDGSSIYSVGRYEPIIDNIYTNGNKAGECRSIPLIQHPIQILYEYQGRESIVMALIDISASESIDEILKSLKQELLLWRKGLKLSKTRSAKTPKKKANKLIKNARIWKSYLIVYDLVDSGKSLEEVSDVLSLSDDFYSDVKNVENHYKNALALLNGGYRKYM